MASNQFKVVIKTKTECDGEEKQLVIYFKQSEFAGNPPFITGCDGEFAEFSVNVFRIHPLFTSPEERSPVLETPPPIKRKRSGHLSRDRRGVKRRLIFESSTEDSTQYEVETD